MLETSNNVKLTFAGILNVTKQKFQNFMIFFCRQADRKVSEFLGADRPITESVSTFFRDPKFSIPD